MSPYEHHWWPFSAVLNRRRREVGKGERVEERRGAGGEDRE